MKYFAIISLIFFYSCKDPNLSTIKGNEDDDGGFVSGTEGDSLIAVDFPNSRILEEAVSLLDKKVQSSTFFSGFKEDFSKELLFLQKNNKFKFISGVNFIGYRRFSGDHSKLFAADAFTPAIEKTEIYLSKKTLKMKPIELAEVIAKEIPHHILPKKRRDEGLVEAIGKSIMNQKFQSPYLEKEVLNTYENSDSVRVYLERFIKIKKEVQSEICSVKNQMDLNISVLGNYIVKIDILRGSLSYTLEVRKRMDYYRLELSDLQIAAAKKRKKDFQKSVLCLDEV